jgi:predicted MFS family arabinose efflux permease
MDDVASSHRLGSFLALNRTVAVVLVTVLFFGLGEQLWSGFMPVYLEAQQKQLAREAATAAGLSWTALWTVGLYACLRNLFEAACYVSGGQVTARLGDRGSLILFAVLTIAGYLLFLAVPLAWAAVLAALLILGWEPLSVPVTFTTVGSSVAAREQGIAFAVQSIQKRLPKIVGPAVAGFVLRAAEQAGATAELGRISGMRMLVGAALALGVVSLAIQIWWMPSRKVPPPGPTSATILRQMHPQLRRLLVAEVFTRWCDWLVREYVVLYIVLVRGVPVDRAGLLFSLQHLVALLTYLPIGRMTRQVGLQPFIGVTFVFFALFPLVLAWVPSGDWLAVAFVVYGLREIGEPARKALITSLMPEPIRARGVGLYWGVRSLAMCSASLVGAVVWHQAGPESLLHVAFGLGCIGAGIFYGLCRER